MRLPRLVLFDEQGLDNQTIRSLKLMILAVVFGIVHFNVVSGIAFAGYLRALGVSDFVFGLLFAIGPMMSPLQLAASYLLERSRKRRGMLIGAGLAQRLIWLPFGLVPFFIPMEYLTMRIWMVSLFLFISAFSGPFMNIAFQSLAADIIPENIRGRYFAVRMRIFTVFGIIGGIFTAWILDSFSPFYSYALVFTLAAVMGTIDVICFFGVKFPEMATRSDEEESMSFLEMLGTVVKNKPYMRFILFMTLWFFALSLSGPFLLVHLREGVMLSNTLITVAVQILPNICAVLIVSRWGRVLDSHGNKTVMQLANGILCFSPFLWIFTTNNNVSVVLIMIIALSNGLLLPGFDLGVNNIMLGSAPKLNRSMYIALYFTCVSILGMALGNATGGWLLDHVFSGFEAQNISLIGVQLTRYSYLFALTAVLRCLIVYVALPRMVPREEKSNMSALDLLRDIISSTRKRLRWRRNWNTLR